MMDHLRSTGLRAAVARPLVLALAVSPAPGSAQIKDPQEDSLDPRICGAFEYVETDGGVLGRQITENCVPAEPARGGASRTTGGTTGLAVGAAGLAVLGLTLALGGSGGGNGDGGTAPANPAPLPPPAKPAPLPPPANASDPAAWRGPEFTLQHGLRMIGVEHRYAKGATGQGTLGAIYDSGIDLGHYDVGGIRRNLSHSYSGSPGDLTDTDGHGTFVYGIAGARRNRAGIHGVAPDAQFMILKWGTNDATGGADADALRRSIAAGADAMNNSWVRGIPDETHPNGVRALVTSDFASAAELRAYLGPALTRQVLETARAGLSVVFATGNDGGPDASVMAGLPHFLPELEGNWIAATALDRSFSPRTARIATYANSCGLAMNWCLAAPGTNIVSLGAAGAEGTDADGFMVASGTSAAAPHVFGAVLVLKSQFPELTTPEVHDILFDTAVDLGAPGTDPVYGRGALNLNEALVPQGQLMVELGPQVDQHSVPLAESWIAGSAVTGTVLRAALSGQHILVTDRYDRGYFASLGQRIAPGPADASPGPRAGLAAAFRAERLRADDLPDTARALRFDAFGPEHDATRIAHADPVMALAGQGPAGGAAGGPLSGVSTRIPLERLTLSLAHARSADTSALSVGAGFSFGERHRLTLTLGRAQETDSLLGARVHGAFGGLRAETVYGRVQADVALGDHATLTGSVTGGRTAFRSTGLLSDGRLDALAMALGLTVTDALVRGDRLSFALARPFAVSGGHMTLRRGTGISAAADGERTNRVRLVRTTVPLGAATRAPELHLGYRYAFDAGRLSTRLGRAALAFGGIARLDGGADMSAARAALVFEF